MSLQRSFAVKENRNLKHYLSLDCKVYQTLWNTYKTFDKVLQTQVISHSSYSCRW